MNVRSLSVGDDSVAVRIFPAGSRHNGVCRPYSIVRHGRQVSINIDGGLSVADAVGATVDALAFLQREHEVKQRVKPFAAGGVPLFVPVVGSVA